MKTLCFPVLVVIFAIMGGNTLFAQDNTTVPRIIIANGGKYESNPPYFDYVTVGSYNTSSHVFTIFDTIHTQSVQDVLIDDHYAYVAAQDTLVKYDLNTLHRLATVADSGLSKLAVYGDKLIVTKQFPVSRFFVEILNTSNLGIVQYVDGVSGDCGGATISDDSIYVAVNGGYLGSEGKLAVISTTSWSLIHEINFGPDAVGIMNVYGYGNFIYTINPTPGGSSAVGSITKMAKDLETFTNNIFAVTIGFGVGIQGNLLYMQMNNGIGSYDLNTDHIGDTSIIRDPGSANHIYILAGALDYVNNDFYLPIGNYSVPGKCVVTTIQGDSLTSFTDGISSNALAVQYSIPAGIQPAGSREEVRISPNPATDWLNVSFNGMDNLQGITISDITGRTLYSSELKSGEKSARINAASFPSGVYFLSVKTYDGKITRKFIKQ
jgi:hypothetical protein